MFRNARLKLTLLFFTLMFVLYLLTTGTIYALMVRLTHQDEDSLLNSSANGLQSQVEQALNRGQFPQEFLHLHSLESLFPRLSTIVLRDAVGQLLADTQTQIAKALPYSKGPGIRTVYLPQSHIWVRLLSIPLTNTYGQITGQLQMALNVTQDVDSIQRLKSVIIEVGVCGAVLAFASGFIASHNALRPIAASWSRQQRFVADASHEIRSPLAVISANLDVVFHHAGESILDNLEWLTNAKMEVSNLTRLTDQLLTLARADASPKVSGHEVVDLLAVVQQVYDTYLILSEAKGIHLSVHTHANHPTALSSDEAYHVFGDPNRLKQLLVILTDNALQYTPTDGTIELRLERRRHTVRIDVVDTGIGIPAHDQPYIFDRFYRGDTARKRSAGGTGLGLSIAQWIVSAHRGKITVTTNVPTGTRLTVLLPAGHPSGSKT